jgi:creatinine amidohydrolase/Fe(II)-dependent formamide hydrolase-like protein
MEEVAPVDGFFGDPSAVSKKLGERVVEKTADKIAADVRRFLEEFPVRKRRSV